MKLPIVEFHILQSFPVSCLNRDDVNSPKSAVIGGVARARVSSQCWKRAIRLKMHEQGTELAIRTKNLADQIAKVAMSYSDNQEKIAKASKALAALVIAKDAMIFVTREEINGFAELLKELDFPEKFPNKSRELNELNALIQQYSKYKLRGALDIALFGRMVAKQADLNIEGACSVAHAVTTHRMENELDFYTAVADDDGDSGAAFLGVAEYSGGTFYRYICLDLNQLAENLCIDTDRLSEESINDLKDAVGAFIRALFVAVPAARQHTMTALCPWDYARILVREGQGIQASFDRPVMAKNGYLEPSIAALDAELSRHEKIFGSKLYGKIEDISFGQDGSLSIEDVIAKVDEVIHE